MTGPFGASTNKPAAAETTSPDPSTSPVVAEARVLPSEGEVRDLTFPTASLDGSVTEEGTVITLKADVFFAYNKATLNSKQHGRIDANTEARRLSADCGTLKPVAKPAAKR